MKSRSITLFSALALSMWAVTASGAAPKVVPFQFTHGGFVSSVTPDGLWAVGVPRAGDHTNLTQIVDLKTGELITLPVSDVIDQDGDSDDSYLMDGIDYYTSAVSADGKLIGGSVDGNPAIWKDGVWTMVEFPNQRRGDKFLGYFAEISAIKGDGRFMTGMAYDEAFDIHPLFWEDGKFIELEGLPEADIQGNKLEDGESNMRFFNVTNDGKKIIGGMSTNMPKNGCCFFVFDRDTKEYNYIGTDELLAKMKAGEIGWESEVDGSVPPLLSNNGRYLAGNVLLVYEPETQYGRDAHLPFLYDLETKKFTLFEGDQHEDVLISGVTDDGRLIGSSPYSSVNRSVMFLGDNNQWYSLENILEQVYGMNFIEAAGYDGLSGTAFGISTDGKTLTAMAPGAVNDGYSVFLDDETFFDATGRVNLLFNSEVAPVAMSNIAVLDKVYVAFENSCAPVNQESVELRDKDGKTIAHSTSVEAYKGNTRLFEITFDPATLTPGERYTVVIPKGSFTIESVGHINNEISVTYVGRENKPMTVESVTPTNGSAINELGATNMVCLNFDGTTQVVTGKTGSLYQEGQEAPIASLVLVANGNKVFAYPTATRKLMLGTNYRIVIPAGAIVDITGYCPNEEITLDFKGAYEIPAPDPYSDYLFYEDFNNMSSSLANLLRYEGDHNEPVSAMVTAFEFDADNQPWNFSIRDNAQSADFVAASHSMYQNNGKSDDWMATPQLVLTDGSEKFILNFQAQNYRKEKEDYLKVLVWECEDVFQSLDKDIVDRMREEGKVIFNEKLTPGKNEDLLEGNWTDYSLDLNDFKGKKIYIAFVNENQNQSIVFVDNINVVRKRAFRTGFIMPETVCGDNTVDVTAFVEVTSENTFNKLTATLTGHDGKVAATYTADDLKLTQESGLYRFTFTPALKLAEGEVNNYTMTVALDGDEQTADGRLSHLLFETTKRVVLEEMTGDWCGNCPQGIIAIEHLDNTVGDNFIPVSIHNGDAMAWPEYHDFLQLTGAPTGKVNRLEKILFPMGQIGDAYSFVSETGDETFTDYVLTQLEVPAVADIEVVSATFNGEDNIEVEASVKFAMNAEEANYNIFTLLVEDGISGRQTNYFSGNPDPIFEGWSDQKSQVRTTYYDIARTMSGGSFYGENGYIPSKIKAGEDYKATIQLPVSSDVKSVSNCKVICMLIDAGTGEIKNAHRLKEIALGDTGVDEIGIDSNASFEQIGGTIYLNGNADGVEVYTLQGARLANSDLAKGLYIVRGPLAGKVVTAKIMVK